MQYDKASVLRKWQEDFCNLLNGEQHDNQVNQSNQVEAHDVQLDSSMLTRPITLREVQNAINRAKNGKSAGFDGIPIEVLRNQKAIEFLHKLFNQCFEKGQVPEMWNKNIISPIPKDCNKDARCPLNYRGISLASVICKIYCSILNHRLSKWVEANNLLEDNQNGFRKNRSCQDQLSSITAIIDNRRDQRKSTYVAFVDFSKAYDRINREKLWWRLNKIGLPAKLQDALQSLYCSVECCVRINGELTDWFPVNVGVKQGCTLSPLLFNLYLNNLVAQMNATGLGIDVDGEKVPILLYADDVALLGESEEELQQMIDVMFSWCSMWDMTVNIEKTKVVHFKRGPATPHTDFVFNYGGNTIDICDRYRYLGLVLTEHLDYNVTARNVSQAAHRALGSIIAKAQLHGGFPYKIFTKLYNTVVQPILDYGSHVWGHKSYQCVEAVQNRALRYFLGVGKRTPIAAMQGDMGWTSQEHRQWITVIRQWCRLSNLNATRVNQKVFQWCLKLSSRGVKNSALQVMTFLNRVGLNQLTGSNTTPQYDQVKTVINQQLKNHFVTLWSEKIQREAASHGGGRNKLRTYRLFKSEYGVEPYVKKFFQDTRDEP